MNYGRLIVAAVVATIVDAIYGILVYGMAFHELFAAYPAVYRAASETKYMPILFSGIFVAMLAATFIYAKGVEKGSGIGEGIRFGILIAFVEVGYASIVGYAMTNIGKQVGASMAIANFVEWVIAGAIIGMVYKPKIAVNVKPATV